MNNASASSGGKEETAKVLLMGRAGAGKTSMRSIIFANYLARETTRLHPTNQVEHSHLRFLGNMTLSLWDCGGQDVFMENYFESQKDHIFRNVRVMIYVVALAGNDQRDAEQQKEITYFKNSMESLRSLSKSAHVYVLLHKFDLVPENEREARFKYYSELLSPYFAGMTTQIFQTSIWDETLYRAWSEIAHSLIPNMDELQRELANFASAVEADEVVLFEKSTFLVIANHTTKQMADPHRFEKVSNIVKQFKLSVNKHHAAFNSLDVSNSNFRAIIDRFTPNTFVMVVTSDPNIHPAATTCNINAARSHFLAAMLSADRRAIYASRFLSPPGFMKRLKQRGKPRNTGPFENPVRRFVRLREKAREFSRMPPPRRIPLAKAPRYRPMMLKEVEGVPQVSPLALEKRLEFLLSEAAVKQQLAEPLRVGYTPYVVERLAWERQMRDLRKIYRAQYLQKLDEVTREEQQREIALYKAEKKERWEKRQARIQAISMDQKRRAVLKDRLRIEARVNEAIEMTRHSKLKVKRMLFLQKLQDRARYITDQNLDARLPDSDPTDPQAKAAPLRGDPKAIKENPEAISLLNRDVNTELLLRQIGGAAEFPRNRNRRIHPTANVFREAMELSYDVLPEDDDLEAVDDEAADEPDALGLTRALSNQQRADLYYGNLTGEEKLEIIENKISMLQEKQKREEEAKGSADILTTKMLDLLTAAKVAYLEAATVNQMKKGIDRDDEQ
ncbi:hypothetical protein FOZ61_010486 [Perkinsus olseni]|uniref:Uncharacterized protein n=3 Tax=Perkinsus olseni TaxID=32597 RepID=A0A7J6M9A3_PEROL|nr:hypothetical protein FOZ61_010486 [Perkinsus olseni]KAF4668085.1 hypothetical protein FOL46_002150 [Perkinsus olseni]